MHPSCSRVMNSQRKLIVLTLPSLPISLFFDKHRSPLHARKLNGSQQEDEKVNISQDAIESFLLCQRSHLENRMNSDQGSQYGSPRENKELCKLNSLSPGHGIYSDPTRRLRKIRPLRSQGTIRLQNRLGLFSFFSLLPSARREK